jgi:hypothetical protein
VGRLGVQVRVFRVERQARKLRRAQRHREAAEAAHWLIDLALEEGERWRDETYEMLRKWLPLPRMSQHYEKPSPRLDRSDAQD